MSRNVDEIIEDMWQDIKEEEEEEAAGEGFSQNIMDDDGKGESGKSGLNNNNGDSDSKHDSKSSTASTASALARKKKRDYPKAAAVQKLLKSRNPMKGGCYLGHDNYQTYRSAFLLERDRQDRILEVS
jgi:hypothetical protein